MSDDHEADTAGHLHFLRKGCIDVIQPDKHRFRVREPSVLFYPRPMQHRLQTDAEDAEIICARIEFGAGILQPLFQSLPDVIHILLKSAAGLGRGVELLFEEAFGELPGRQAALDRLAKYVLILLLRDVAGRELIQSGTLRGLSDERLSKALMAMHQHPEGLGTWTDLPPSPACPGLALLLIFEIKATSMAYLTDWRMAVVQTMLRKG